MHVSGSTKALVSLMGAGTGDCELWTRRAVDRLERADLVLHDSTVDVRDVRRFTEAECRSVGQTVHQLMIRAARAGKRVVRVYGGEAFMFSGGSEEALALQAAGIPFEVVPDVSPAIAVPEVAGIPVTHRGVASAFLVLSNPSPGTLLKALQGAQPKTVSLVVSIDRGEGRALATALIEHGWRVDTPAAVVSGAATSAESVWTGSLAQLQTADVPADARGFVVVGDVVHVRDAVAERSFACPPHIEVHYGRS